MKELILNEEEVSSLLIESLGGKLAKEITGYNRKLDEIVDTVINEHEEAIFNKLDSMLDNALKSKDFGKALQEEFNRKVAKNLVAKLEGSVEKAVNDYRNNPLLKAKMINALNELIEKETNRAE